MNTATDSLLTKTPLTGGGLDVGQSAADLVGFYGTTPVVQPTSASQAAITYTAGNGTASATSGFQALTSSYNSGIIANALVTLAAQGNAMQAALLALGLIKGS